MPSNEGLMTLNLITLLLAFGIVDRWIKMKTYRILFKNFL